MVVCRWLSLETAALSSVPCKDLVCAIRGGAVINVMPDDIVTMIEVIVVSVVRIEDMFTRHGRPVFGISWNAVGLVNNFSDNQFL